MTNIEGAEHLGLPSSTGEIPASEDESEPPLNRPSLLARRLFRLQSYHNNLVPSRRRKREMTPDEKKDALYWVKRQKNNEAAHRSREKRRLNDFMLESQLLALSEENAQLRAEVLNLQYHMGIGRSRDHPHHAMMPFHIPVSSHLKRGLAGAKASFLAERSERYQCWPHHEPCSGPLSGPSQFISPSKMPYKNTSAPSQIRHSNDKLSEQSMLNSDSFEQNPAEVSSSNDPPSNPQPFPTQRAAALLSPSPPPPHLTQSWLLPGINHPAIPHHNQMLPWTSSSLRPSLLHPSWPLTTGARSLWNFNSRLSTLQYLLRSHSYEEAEMQRNLK
ncbi:Nuclear factor interleukin-3-regulated protein E4 promoter-binding protein 4 [Triplophysa tibetana]|uniref:Nuclear factor interleukin-3-regulated protein E4 promoter-binding protein 4 n=1 Tax=Triplophysa tibetana TaxID=1572043 RepID=A0A5A9NQ26_9TELE|nr:Nuclear factor interleukin-3-regulated protein E4 promoter-binding protein 4 [Triplophysa tibetana]